MEQRTFVIPSKSDPHDVADELDAALDLGWRYVTALNCGGGLVVILERERPAEVADGA